MGVCADTSIGCPRDPATHPEHRSKFLTSRAIRLVHSLLEGGHTEDTAARDSRIQEVVSVFCTDVQPCIQTGGRTDRPFSTEGCDSDSRDSDGLDSATATGCARAATPGSLDVSTNAPPSKRARMQEVRAV